MNDIDKKIRDALSREDAELLDHFRAEPPLGEMMIETFRGRFRWLNALAIVGTLIILALIALAAYKFFHTDSTRAMIAWATAFVWGLLWIVLMKIWFWLEIQKNAVTREIKRLELQVANLSRQLSTSK